MGSMFVRLLTSEALPGWTSTVRQTYFLGSIQRLALASIDKHLVKVYEATEPRPRDQVGALAGLWVQR